MKHCNKKLLDIHRQKGNEELNKSIRKIPANTIEFFSGTRIPQTQTKKTQISLIGFRNGKLWYSKE